MENDRFNKIIEATKSVKLTHEEKASLFQAVSRFVEEHPLTQEVKVPRVPTYKQFHFLAFIAEGRYSVPAMVLVFVLIFSGSTSLAAAGALPGDVLYPIKVSVNENVETLLAVGPEAKAEVETKHALARLSEAEQLLSSGTLTQETSDEIQARFDSEVEKIDKNIQNLNKKKKFEAVAKINEDFERGLESHYAAVSNSKEEAVMQDSATLSFAVQSTEVPVMQINAKKIPEISAVGESAEDDSFTRGKISAEQALFRAQEKVKEARSYIDSNSTASTSPDIKKESYDKLTRAEKSILSGQEKMMVGEYGNARALFQEASRVAQEAKTVFNFKVSTVREGGRAYKENKQKEKEGQNSKKSDSSSKNEDGNGDSD